MRKLLQLVLCWLILQHACGIEPSLEAEAISPANSSKQYIQWAVTVTGECHTLSYLPPVLTRALQRDVQVLLRTVRESAAKSNVYSQLRVVLPDQGFVPSCDRVKSKSPVDVQSAYAAIRVAVVLQQHSRSSAHIPVGFQKSVVSQLNRGWSRCSAAFPAGVFSNVAGTLKKAGLSAVIIRASTQAARKRSTIPLRELRPCHHTSVVTSPSPSPVSPAPVHSPNSPNPPPAESPQVSTSPAPSNPSPGPSESPLIDSSPAPPSPSPVPQPLSCASFTCAPGTLLKPNASTIILSEFSVTELRNSSIAQTVCCDADCSLVPGSILQSGSCICSGTNNVKLLNGAQLTACLAAETPCGSGAAADYPVTARPTLGMGPAEACLTVNSSCPGNLPLPFFKSPSAGVAAKLLECSSAAQEYHGCQSYWGFQRRVEEQDGRLVGCLSDDFATMKCPEEYGYGFAYWDANMRVLLCRPSTQQDCPYIGSLDNVQIWNADDQLVGCALIPAEGRCPDEYPVFVMHTLDPPNNHLVQCRASRSGCPTSDAYTRNFPFFLVEGTTLQGCLAPQSGFTTCSRYHAWNGVPVFGGLNYPSGCIARTASSCWPPNYLPYYDTSRSPPLLVQCHPPLQQRETCQTRSVIIDNKQYLLNAKRADGTIVACLRSLYPCPSRSPADYPVYAASSWEARNLPVECLARNITTCNMPQLFPRTFSLYRGTRTRLPKVDVDVDGRAPLPVPIVEGCVEKSAREPDDCTNPSYGSAAASVPEAERCLYTAEVWGNADGTKLVGCVSSGKGTIAADNTRIGNPIPTPCPESQPFFLQSTGGNGRGDYLTECRPARSSTSCDGLIGTSGILATYRIALKTVSGEVVGCKQLGYTPDGKHCPAFTGIATDLASETSIVDDLSDGAPYHFPLLVLQRASVSDASPALAECRPYIGYSSFEYPRSCHEYGSMGAATVPVIMGVSDEVYPDTYIGVSVLAACTVPTARCPTTRDLGVAFRYIPMLTSNANGVMVAACLWEHVLELQPCGGRFAIPITTATDPNTAPDRTNIFGCLAIGSAPTACANLKNDGFPFAYGSYDLQVSAPGASLTRFVQQTTPAETSTLVRCASDQQWCKGPEWATPVYNRRLPYQVLGCVSGGGPTADEIQACNLWAQRFYSPGMCRI